jgi:hypothetical protein
MASVSLASALSMLKLAAFCRGGNSALVVDAVLKKPWLRFRPAAG